MMEPLSEMNAETSPSSVSTTRSLAEELESEGVAGDPMMESNFANEYLSVQRSSREVSSGGVPSIVTAINLLVGAVAGFT